MHSAKLRSPNSQKFFALKRQKKLTKLLRILSMKLNLKVAVRIYIEKTKQKNKYRISSYNCCGNYSFLNSSSEETIQVFISLM